MSELFFHGAFGVMRSNVQNALGTSSQIILAIFSITSTFEAGRSGTSGFSSFFSFSR